jgi:VacB/RNase II family 3'-5' exoribonuclease
MIERGLLPEFSSGVMAEAAGLSARDDEDPGIRDLRHWLWASIDNDESLDLDQLTYAEPVPGKGYRIFIAVADVDAVVKKGTEVDGHARHNTTSVYTAAETFSMLPERLSTDVTSLGAGRDRLAIIVEVEIEATGAISGSKLYRALVHNHAKLAYNSLSEWIEGRGPAPERLSALDGLEKQIRLQDRIARILKNWRHCCGALSLQTIEAKPVFDGDWVMDLKAEPVNRTRELIEQFMIAANEMTTRFLEDKGLPSLRRVLRSPLRWARIMEIADGLGWRLPDEPDSGALESFLSERKRVDPDRFPDLSLAIVKLIGSGEYAVEFPGGVPQGHFGLALRDYTHSTAPNRRFPDLITQRLVKAALAGDPVPYDPEELISLAGHCTEKEDDANKVERLVRKSAAALLLESKIGQRFEGIVTGASEKGTWVRIFHPPVEGKLVHGFDGLDVGDRVMVELISTNMERGFIDFVRSNRGHRGWTNSEVKNTPKA